MRKPAKRRAPHGATAAIVLDALWRLHTKGGRRVNVPRAKLLLDLSLPETTVDDRLRTLVKAGRVLRVGRALYVPKPWPGSDPRGLEAGGIRGTPQPDGRILAEELLTQEEFDRRALSVRRR
jgi:hypothetical protein